MIQFRNGGILVQSLSELPNLQGAKDIYVDFETSSGNPKIKSINPWKNCRPIGTCITVDNAPNAWYIPWELEHKQWLQDIFDSCTQWINQNIKYDAHVATRAGVTPPERLVDTLTLAKLISSDRLRYGLKILSKDWLQHDIDSMGDRVESWLAQSKSKDFGDCPTDILAEYGCQDVLTNRELWGFIQEKMPEQCRTVQETETKLTTVLYDIEQTGLRVNPTALKIKEFQLLSQLLEWDEKLDELCGFPIRANTNADCFKYLVTSNGLPVLKYTDKDEPSFDKYALQDYLLHPIIASDEKLTQAVKLMLAYRKMYTFLSFFVSPFSEHQQDGLLHPEYNQCVRTGRMSCSRPNSQNMNSSAKSLILPVLGEAFLSADYSQVEFRLIIHYIRNAATIRAYIENPDTDFHRWVAGLCDVPRDPAKSVNFAIGYGGGKPRVLLMLSGNMELMGRLKSKAKGDAKLFASLCRSRAEDVYNTYHRSFPELKVTTRQAALALNRKGYVFNAYGRHRHLPKIASYRAFNNITQSTAADICKEKMVELSPRFNPRLRDAGIRQVASVHDEILFQGPERSLRQNAEYIRSVMESPSVPFKVPIRVDLSLADTSWADTGAPEAALSRPGV